MFLVYLPTSACLLQLLLTSKNFQMWTLILLDFFYSFFLVNKCSGFFHCQGFFFSGPREWYSGNSKAKKKMLQAFLEQENFFSIPTMWALAIRGVCPVTQNHSFGLPPVQKKPFSSDFVRTYVCICSKFRTLKFMLDFSRFKRSEKRGKTYCVHIRHKYFYIFTNTLVNMCCNFPK